MRSWDDYKKTMQTPETLWSAAKANDLEGLRRLIASTKDMNAKDHRGCSALMLAVYGGHYEAARALLAAGADPNSADFGGNTALMSAAAKGHLDIVNELLRIGASPDQRNSSGLTALDFATTFGRTGVVAVLRGVSPKSSVSRVGAIFKIFTSRLAAKVRRY